MKKVGKPVFKSDLEGKSTEEKMQLDLYRKRKTDFRFHLPRYNDLTELNVYMNQLLNILDETLSQFAIPGEEKTITKSMINNYVQKRVILPPVNKKYGRVHIIHLITIGVLKQVISIEEINQIIHMQLNYYPKIGIAYNYFCIALEDALNGAFNNIRTPRINREKRPPTLLSELIDSCVITFAHRIFVKKALYIARPKNHTDLVNSLVNVMIPDDKKLEDSGKRSE